MANTIEIKITAQNSQALAALKQVADEANKSAAKIKAACSSSSDSFKQLGDDSEKAAKRIKAAGSGDAFSGAQKNGEGFLGSLSKVGTAAFGIIGKLQTLKDVAGAVFGPGIEYDRQMESARQGIAGILMSMTTLNGEQLKFNEAIQISDDTVKKIQANAVKFGLPSQEMISTFQSLVGPGLQANMSLDEIVKLTATGTRAAKTLMGPQANEAQVAQELQSIISGNITQDSKIASRLGISNEEIEAAKESAGGLFDYLMDRMSGFQDAFPDSVQGKFDQLEGAWKLASSKFVDAFQEPIKEGLQEITECIGTVNSETGNFELNPAILSFIDDLKSGFQELQDYAKDMSPLFEEWKSEIFPIIESLWNIVKNLGVTFLDLSRIVESALMPLRIFALEGVRELANDIEWLTGKIREYVNYLVNLLGLKRTNSSPPNSANNRQNADKNNKPSSSDIKANSNYTRTSDKGYQDAGKQVDIALEREKGRLAGIIDTYSNQIKEMEAKTHAGYQLSLEEQAKIAAIQLQIAEEKLNSLEIEKNIVSGLYQSDTDGSHKADVDKKIASLNTEAGGLAAAVDAARKNFNGLKEVIVTFSNVANGTASGIDGLSSEVLKAGEQQLGIKYNLGGDGISTTDCGEFTLDTFKKAGINLVDRLANHQYDQYAKAGAIKNDLSSAKPGDLLFFYYPGTQQFDPGETRVGHVGIYAGENKMLHASSSRGQVAYTGIDITHLVGIGDTEKLVSGGAAGSPVTYAAKAKEFKKQLENKMIAVSEGIAKAQKFAEDIWDKAASVEAQYHELLGDSSYKSNYDIESKYNQLRKSLEPGGAAMKQARDMVDKMEAIEKNRADFNQTQKAIERSNKQLVEDENSLLLDVATGAKTSDEAIDAYSKSYKSAMEIHAQALKEELKKAETETDREYVQKIRNQLTQMLTAIKQFSEAAIAKANDRLQYEIDMINADPSLTNLEKSHETNKRQKTIYRNNSEAWNEYANKLSDPTFAAAWQADPKNRGKDIDLEILTARRLAAINRVKGAEQSLEDQINNAGRQGLENGLVNFFESGYRSCHKLIDAVRELAISILTEMNKIYAQDLARRLMSSIWPTSSRPTIDGQPVQGPLKKDGSFAKGGSLDSGQVKGPGTGTSDSILAYLGNYKKFVAISDGEYVIKADSVKKYGTGFFDRLNNGLIPDAFGQIKAEFAGGGATSGARISSAQDLATSFSNNSVTNVPLKIINLNDPNEVGRYLTSRPGEKVMVNWMRNNAETVRQILKIRG